MLILLRSQFVLFLLVGGTAAAVNIVSRVLVNHWTSYAVAVVVAYVVGMATAFVLNRIFVFKESSRAVHHQAAWFVAVNALALIQTLAVSLLLAKWLLPAIGIRQHAEVIGHFVGVIVPIGSSYFGHKYLSFRE